MSSAYTSSASSSDPLKPTRRLPPAASSVSAPASSTLDSTASTTSVRPAVPFHIVVKLLFFTFLMISAPIGTYFLTAATIFKGNNTWAGASAALVANGVLIGYILVAIWEDQGDDGEDGGGEKRGNVEGKAKVLKGQ